MAVKRKMKWQDYFPSCFKPEIPARDKKKPVSKQTSFQRISLSDLSSSTIISEDLSISLAGSNLHVFTLQELKVITQNFSPSNFLGEGGFGPVHKGFIDDKLRPGLKAQPVAVKLLDLDGTQGHREWLVCIRFLFTLFYNKIWICFALLVDFVWFMCCLDSIYRQKWFFLVN